MRLKKYKAEKTKEIDPQVIHVLLIEGFKTCMTYKFKKIEKKWKKSIG